jgi:hypothetical protein
MRDNQDPEAELAARVERLKFGGTQQQCQELRTKIDSVHRAIAGRSVSGCPRFDHSEEKCTMIGLHAGSAVTAAFLASLVEAVEALTIVLAVAVVRGLRPALLGAIAGLALLALIVVALGPLLDRVPPAKCH